MHEWGRDIRLLRSSARQCGTSAKTMKYSQSSARRREDDDVPHHRIDAAIRVNEEQLARYLDATKRERSADDPCTMQRRPRPRITL